MFDIFVESFGKFWWALGYIEVVRFDKSCPWSHFLSTFLHPFSTKNKTMNHNHHKNLKLLTSKQEKQSLDSLANSS